MTPISCVASPPSAVRARSDTIAFATAIGRFMRFPVLRKVVAAFAAAAAIATLPGAVEAQAGATLPSPQSSFDRTAVPTPDKDPELKIPTWTTSTLSNGAQLVVSERHTLPLVSFTINFVGGSYQQEPADKTGLSNFVAAMLSEGTTLRTGDEISLALQLLGTTIGASIGGEAGYLGFVSIKDKFGPALDILAEMMLHPSFPADALERLRARTLVSLTQERDRTAGIANVVFPRTLYSLDHPYGRTRSEASITAITRDDLVAFHADYFRPGRAVITVVGDITLAEARAQIERALGAWTGGGSRPAFTYPAPPPPSPTTIYLVDKPGAAQSTVAIGSVGPPRNTPDYYALRVMNSLFGELFLSRLNANIREDKGYSYGVGSRFAFGRGPGAFRAGGDIQTGVTDSALVEFMKEIRGIRGDRPLDDDEIAAAKAALIQSLPGRLESVAGVSGIISEIFVQGLPEDYYQQFTREIERVTKDDVVRVARKYVDPDHLAIVIVGDRATIESPLRATGIAPIVVLTVDPR